ncbi:hypothetical protein V6N11_047285 [Hibiscus sabdariffa]|uniref:Uncharacterized protein n=1 Tax=Hibiscus sabdariffa TaxID=183260 RepID=A0ABR2NCC4_9ROSI
MIPVAPHPIGLALVSSWHGLARTVLKDLGRVWGRSRSVESVRNTADWIGSLGVGPARAGLETGHRFELVWTPGSDSDRFSHKGAQTLFSSTPLLFNEEKRDKSSQNPSLCLPKPPPFRRYYRPPIDSSHPISHCLGSGLTQRVSHVRKRDQKRRTSLTSSSPSFDEK